MGGKSSKNQTTVSQSPNPAVMEKYLAAIGKAETASETPYTPYGGQMVAGLTPDQQAAFGNINNAAEGAGQTPAYESVGDYMSPFLGQVVDATSANLDENDAQQMEALKSGVIGAGAFGGDRGGIAAGNLQRQQNLARGQTIGGLLNSGYQTAQNTAMVDQSNLLNQKLQGANAQLQSGTLQQQQQQNQLNAAYQQFMQQQAYPFQTSQFYTNSIAQMGPGMGGTSTTTAPPPNMAGTYGGLGLLAASMFAKDGGAVKGFDAGGAVGPWPEAQGYVPRVSTMPGMARNALPVPAAAPQQQSGVMDSFTRMIPLMNSLKGKLASGQATDNAGSIPDPNAWNGTDMPSVREIPYFDTIQPMGGFAGFEEGGEVGEEDFPQEMIPQAPEMRVPFSGGSRDVPAQETRTSTGLLGLDKSQKLALAAAGFGMLSSRSPYAAEQIGQGGMQGLHTYSQQQQLEQQTKKLDQAARLADERLRIQSGNAMRQEKQGERRLELDERRLNQGERHQRENENKPMVVGGNLVDRKGNVIFKGGSTSMLDDETVSDMAGQYLAGDKSVFQNLGRGAQGSENVVRLRQEVARQAKELGLTPDQVATKMADFAGRTAAMRALGTRGVNVEYAANTANLAIDLAQEASDKVPRSQFVPFNQLKQLYETKKSSPEQAAFYAATNTLVNEYARVASGGSNQATEGMRHHAREMLNTAQGPEAYKAVLNMMRREIQSAKKAFQDTRKEFLDDHGNKNPEPEKTTTPVGHRKQFKQGWGVWDGNKYVQETKEARP